jgi:DNA polymerase III epsilon subunit-like protein
MVYSDAVLDRVVIIDTETGGLEPDEHSLLTLALVTGRDTARLDLTIAEPTIVVTPKSLEINRLDPAQIAATGLPPAAACDAIEAFLERNRPGQDWILCGHNVTFDVNFLKRLYRLAGRPYPKRLGHRTIDTHTLLWALGATGRLPPLKGSDDAFRHFGLEPPTELRHTALGDAVATQALLVRLLESM